MNMPYSEFRKTIFVRRKKLSRRRGTPWYRHRDAWAKSYRRDFGSMRMAMLARYWISTMRDCEDIAKKYAARNNE